MKEALVGAMPMIVSSKLNKMFRKSFGMTKTKIQRQVYK